MRLGVNIDHVATLRQARRVAYPSVLDAARVSVEAGADQITMHLREDRRHIQDVDVEQVRANLKIPLNLEMAITPFMMDFACRVKPDWVCLVPEKREEITTEGGLDVVNMQLRLADCIRTLHTEGIRVSPFIAPTLEAIGACAEAGADAVELHTGEYAHAKTPDELRRELQRIYDAARMVKKIGMHCHAGHGLTLDNVGPIAKVREIEELNIGHSIIAEAVFYGLYEAVARMKRAIQNP